MQTRIYLVTNTQRGLPARLIEAASAAQAIRHVVSKEYAAVVPTTKEVAHAMAAGIQVEAATSGAPEHTAPVTES